MASDLIIHVINKMIFQKKERTGLNEVTPPLQSKVLVQDY